MKEKYRDYTITYNESQSRFEFFLKETEETRHAPTLAEVKKKIDRMEDEPGEKPKKQSAQLALSVSECGDREDGIIRDYNPVSVGAFGYLPYYRGGKGELNVWLTPLKRKHYSDKERTRERVERLTLYKDTPQAREALDKCKLLLEEVRAFIVAKLDEQEKILAKIEKVKPTLKDEELPNW